MKLVKRQIFYINFDACLDLPLRKKKGIGKIHLSSGLNYYEENLGSAAHASGRNHRSVEKVEIPLKFLWLDRLHWPFLKYLLKEFIFDISFVNNVIHSTLVTLTFVLSSIMYQTNKNTNNVVSFNKQDVMSIYSSCDMYHTAT